MMTDPACREVDRIGLTLVDRFVSFDITDDPDPGIEARIAEIHRRRFADHEDITELVSGIDSYSGSAAPTPRSEEHTSELQSRGQLVCRLLLEKKKTKHK